MLVTTNNKGTVKKTPILGGEIIEIPSWSSYQIYWSQHYPMLKVRKPTEDICSYCYKFYNQHKFRCNGSQDPSREVGTSLGIEVDVQDEEDDQQSGSIDDTDLNAPVRVDASTRAMEIDILDAAMHVKKARAMRSLVNEKVEISRHDRQQQTPHSDRTYTIVANYCQNMALPHFGKEQPGDTYYLAPINLYGFGVVDVSHADADGKEADHLFFHCYLEGHGAKGGNNVASLLMKTLRKTEMLQYDAQGSPVPGKEQNIIMDNCGGQNKTNYVLLLAPFLVEMGFFRKVNMLFLVVGHTKNVCDR
jgi:hypothetical protein